MKDDKEPLWQKLLIAPLFFAFQGLGLIGYHFLETAPLKKIGKKWQIDNLKEMFNKAAIQVIAEENTPSGKISLVYVPDENKGFDLRLIQNATPNDISALDHYHRRTNRPGACSGIASLCYDRYSKRRFHLNTTLCHHEEFPPFKNQAIQSVWKATYWPRGSW